MKLADTGRLALAAIVRFPLRTTMLLIATAIGVSAVMVLTSLGEGGRRYVTDQFQALGANLLVVLPGKNDVAGGGIAGLLGGTTRDLTLDDARAIARSPHVAQIAPVIPGSATVEYSGLVREITVLGTSASIADIQRFELASGRFLPPGDLDRAEPVVVLGHALVDEMFAGRQPIGQWIRLGDRRFRVIGTMRDAAMFGGVNLNETLFIPVASAQQLFNTEGLFRLMVETTSADAISPARQHIVETIKARHYGNDDVTIVQPDALASTFSSVFVAISAALGAIAAISLAVAGTLIMNVMLVAVSQRTEEIGLFKALGARRRQIITLFLTEAALLSLLGAGVGLVLGYAGVLSLRKLYPVVDFHAPWWAVTAAVVIALACGLLFGILPARRAADLDPVAALSGR